MSTTHVSLSIVPVRKALADLEVGLLTALPARPARARLRELEAGLDALIEQVHALRDLARAGIRVIK